MGGVVLLWHSLSQKAVSIAARRKKNSLSSCSSLKKKNYNQHLCVIITHYV